MAVQGAQKGMQKETDSGRLVLCLLGPRQNGLNLETEKRRGKNSQQARLWQSKEHKRECKRRQIQGAWYCVYWVPSKTV